MGFDMWNMVFQRMNGRSAEIVAFKNLPVPEVLSCLIDAKSTSSICAAGPVIHDWRKSFGSWTLKFCTFEFHLSVKGNKNPVMHRNSCPQIVNFRVSEIALFAVQKRSTIFNAPAGSLNIILIIGNVMAHFKRL